MKKWVYLLCLLVLLLSFCTPAISCSTFTLTAYKPPTTQPLEIAPIQLCEGSTGFYVRHYIVNGSSAFTNLFQVLVLPQNQFVVQKWCTPGISIPVAIDNWAINRDLGLVMRWNSRHYDLTGLTSVTANGYTTCR